MPMTHIIYEIIKHDGGWAFKLGDTISETFPNHDAAFSAAKRVAMEQQRAGETAAISWEDERGKWHEELSRGDDRPEVDVRDSN